MSCECCLSIVVGQVGSRQKGSVQGRAGRGSPGYTPREEAREVGGRTGGRKGGVEDNGTDIGDGAWGGECLSSVTGDDVKVARGEGLECRFGSPDGDDVAGRGGRLFLGDGEVLDLAELEDLGPVGTSELILGLTEPRLSVDPSGDCFPFEMAAAAAAAAAAATVAAMIRSAFLLVELEPFIMSDSILLHARVSRANGLLLASNGGCNGRRQRDVIFCDHARFDGWTRVMRERAEGSGRWKGRLRSSERGTSSRWWVEQKWKPKHFRLVKRSVNFQGTV